MISIHRRVKRKVLFYTALLHLLIILASCAEIEAEPEIETTTPLLLPSYEQYIGYYSTNHREDRDTNPEHSAGYGLRIYSISDDEITFSIGYTGAYWSPIYETGLITATLDGNTADFEWTDSWNNEGHGTLQLEDGNVIVRMIETVTADGNRASFDTGTEILLKPLISPDFIQEQE
jgi:hypothetical protein